MANIIILECARLLTKQEAAEWENYRAAKAVEMDRAENRA